MEKGKTSRSQEIDGKLLQEEVGSSDRSVKPEKLSEDIRVKHDHDGTGHFNEQKSSSACKEYTSYYRKLTAENVQLQREQRHEH